MPEPPPRKAHPHPSKSLLPKTTAQQPGYARKAAENTAKAVKATKAANAVTSAEVQSSPVGYCELHCVSNFTFQRGASHPDELVARAKELGYAALAITDEASLAGIVRAHVAAKDAGLKLIVGAELAPEDSARVIVLATV